MTVRTVKVRDELTGQKVVASIEEVGGRRLLVLPGLRKVEQPFPPKEEPAKPEDEPSN